MAHAEGWIEAYELLEKGDDVPPPLLKKILGNRSSIGETMLHWYALEGTPEVVEKILQLGFDVNTQNDFGQTPLFECVKIDRWDIAELLIAHGAKADIKNENNEDIWEELEFMEEHEKISRLKELIT